MRACGPNCELRQNRRGGADCSVNDAIILDAGPLGMVAHPRARLRHGQLVNWLKQRLANGTAIIVPEIADYEVRRELLRAKLFRSVERLDDLKAHFTYLPITTAMMLRAAEFWADARIQGFQTAGNQALDGDVILAAQAIEVPGAKNPIIVTDNIGHLSRYAKTDLWQNIT